MFFQKKKFFFVELIRGNKNYELIGVLSALFCVSKTLGLEFFFFYVQDFLRNRCLAIKSFVGIQLLSKFHKNFVGNEMNDFVWGCPYIMPAKQEKKTLESLTTMGEGLKNRLKIIDLI